MRAAMLTAPGIIELVDRERADLRPDEVRVRVQECGVCTSDLHLWAGDAPELLPIALGHEVAGIVEQVGGAVAGIRAGDRVAAWSDGGGFADEVVVPERFCVVVGEALDYPAVAEPLACVVNAVELAAPALGDDVVIVGAGYMGHLIQMVTGLKGPRSIVVADVRPEALDAARALGATAVVDVSSASLEDVVAEVTGGRGADLTYEVTGNEHGLAAASAVTRMSGKVCIVGYHQGGPRSIPLGHWNWMAFEVINAHFRDKETIMRGMRAGMALVDAGVLQVGSLVSERYPLDRIGEAFTTAAARPAGFVKAVIEPGAR
jgi:L-iditol 2-dehydrogenase